MILGYTKSLGRHQDTAPRTACTEVGDGVQMHCISSVSDNQHGVVLDYAGLVGGYMPFIFKNIWEGNYKVREMSKMLMQF